MFWRVLVDRVMYYGSLDTFTMICIAFGVILLFETAFGHLRRYLVLFITTRTDVKLWSYTFDKVLNLPIDYFEQRSTGEFIQNFHEMGKIRGFLTTQLFGTALDALVIVFFLPIMFFFSTIMTVCVLVLSLLICGWLVAMLPAIRRRVVAVAAAGTWRGSFLVETIHGIRAVKSLALDARQRHQWDVHCADVAEKRYAEGLLTNWVQTVVHPLQILMTNGVIAIAVYLALVNKDPMYIGAIVAFMMLTSRVVAPMIQASQAIVQIDEARVAVKGVAEMVNREAEEGRSGRGIRSPLIGRVEFSERLPRGYETFIQEGSTNLSGGQRQRLAIARALIGDPRILILDEATSALDADSEAIVNANLLRIAQGRTLIIISHRLSSLVNADAILVLERGGVYDIGAHEELLDRCDIYSGLWHQQHRHLITRSSTHEVIPFPSAAQ